MLGKLLKYDLKAIFRLLFPLYLAGFILAVMNGFFLIPTQAKIQMLQYDFWSAILELFRSMSMMAILSLNLITIIWCLIRVYNSIFAKEGYLTNTLPVSHHQILISKIISSSIACAATGLVVSILSLIFSIGYLEFAFEINMILEYFDIAEIMEIIKQVPIAFVYSTVLCAILVSIGYILTIFLSMALGHLTKHRVVMSFVAFFAIQYVIIQPATSAVLFAYLVKAPISFESFLYGVDGLSGVLLEIVPIIWVVIALYGAISAIFYSITAYILKNKLNLQ